MTNKNSRKICAPAQCKIKPKPTRSRREGISLPGNLRKFVLELKVFGREILYIKTISSSRRIKHIRSGIVHAVLLAFTFAIIVEAIKITLFS